MVSIRWGWESVRGLRCGADEERLSADLALLRAGQAGDHAALERLIAQYQRPLFGLCYGILQHAEDAEDAVQETFLRALRGLPDFREQASFRTWLFRIAVNLCLNRKRDRRPSEPWDEDRLSLFAEAGSPEATALRRLRMVEALGTLLPRHRAILLLKEREGWSVAEIAAALGWKAKRVEHELSRARHALAAWRQQDAEDGEVR
jgi:RNA polymerase sigma-70 factor (ECF subfamily)